MALPFQLSWEWLVLYLAIALVSLRILFPFFVYLFVPSLRLGAITPFGLNNLVWTSRVGGRNPSERVRIEIGRVGWTCWGSKNLDKGWFILKLARVRVVVPKAALLAPPRPNHSDGRPSRQRSSSTPTEPPPTPRKKPKARAGPGAALSSFTRSAFVDPAIRRITALLARLSSMLGLFAVEVDFTIEVEDVARVTGNLSGGAEVLRHAVTTATTPIEDQRARISTWIALGSLQILEVLPPPTLAPEVPPPPILPALEMRERVVLTVSAPVKPPSAFLKSKGACFVTERASVRASVLFGDAEELEGDGEGVHVRVHELKRIIGRAEELANERRKLARAQKKKDESDADSQQASQDGRRDNGTATPQTLATKPSPLFFLRSIELSLPLFVVSAHYNTPLHILAASPTRQLPRSVAFALTVKGVEGKLYMEGTSDIIKRDHLEWIGKGKRLGLGGHFGWREVEGRIKVDGSEEDILPDSAKAISIGPSSLQVTSTCMPSSLVASLAAHAPDCTGDKAPRLLNDELVIVEGFLGEMRGHATFETIDSALRIFMARPRGEARSAPTNKDDHEPLILRRLPRVVGNFASAGIEIRIQAPLNHDPAEQEDHFYRSWSSPELFCISFPNGAISFGAEYLDRSVKRTEADRRVAKRLAEQQAKQEAQRASRPHGTIYGSTRDLEEALGVPAPPPVTRPHRQHLPKRPDASLSVDLDVHSLKYVVRTHLAAETLNVYILATNHGSNSADDAAGWLEEKPVLPSDPIRLDILAIGPVELVGTQELRGTEEEGPSGPVATLDPATLNGEVHLLVETIGVDLWQPIVMGSIRDFLSSIASATATSTLRTTSSFPPPRTTPVRPLIQSFPVDQYLYVAVATFDLRIAGSDPKNDEQACRGVAAHCGPLVLEYLLQSAPRPRSVNYANRSSLEMREDVRVEANAHLADNKDVRQALFKLSATDFNIDPVADARSSRGHTRNFSQQDGSSERDEEDWELRSRAQISDLVRRRNSIMPVRTKETGKGVVGIPHLALRVRVKAATSAPEDGQEQALDDISVVLDAETIALRIELFSIYLVLVAISTLRSLKPKPTGHATPPRHPPSSPSSPPPPTFRRPPPILDVRVEVADVNMFPTLPHNVPLFAHVRRLRVEYTKTKGALVEWDMLLLAGDSPTEQGKWEDIVRLRVTTLAIRPEPDNDGQQPFVVSLESESARLRIPFRYVFSRIVDNTANLIKATKQLVHQHIKGGLDFVLEPVEEQAKRLPKIDLKVHMFAIELQDDPFETRLNIIWRAGYEEQTARLELDAEFQAKKEAIERAEAGGDLDDPEAEGAETTSAGPRKKKFDARHTIGIAEAEYELRKYNSHHWAGRVRNAIAEQGRREDAVARRLYGPRHNSQRPDALLPVELLPASRSAPLARVTLHDLRFTITKHSMPPEQLPDFLHDVGKGLPRDTKFTLLVPLHFSWKLSEALVRLRDYPLPLLHIPPMDPHRQNDHVSWECEADLVIGEEVCGPESIRRVPCPVVPAHATRGGSSADLYTIVVPRSAMPVKTYATPTVKIRSPRATRIGWGNSISPAIQDLAKVLDSLSKATPDPSDRIGFWDKIRLQLHWRVQVLFQGEGAVHFHLKGSRDPYALTGFGAGFVKSWHGDVRFLLGFDNPDREFFQITSREYILGIPNLRAYVDAAATGVVRDAADTSDTTSQNHPGSSNSNGDYQFGREGDFIKVCAKFINGVRWGLGAVLERACGKDCEHAACKDQKPFHRQCRLFDFEPHWSVHTKTEASIGPQGEITDSFAGFRSDFIHFSISLTSPLTLRLPSDTSSPVGETDYDGSDGYNSMHFTPNANAHFARWWKLFDGTMSLPIRQGKLFPSATPPSKKFGKHCATIKYRFSLAPLFISHTYRQELWEEWHRGETTVLGVKGKIGRFNVDLHQREQEDVIRNPDTGETKTILHKAFYMAEVDCDGVDLRALTACFQEPEKATVAPVYHDVDAEVDEHATGPPPAEYTFTSEVSDEDRDWVDLDDFNDSMYTIPDKNPSWKMLPFIVCPRFTYIRRADATKPAHNDPPSSEHCGHGREDLQDDRPADEAPRGPKTKFGNEPSHTCFMNQAKDNTSVQIEAAQSRLVELELEATSHLNSDSARAEIERQITSVRGIIVRLLALRDDARDGARTSMGDDQETSARKRAASGATGKTAETEDGGQDTHLPHITSTLYEGWGEWENRYVIHNPKIEVSNVTRDVLLKYYYSSTERRGFVYHVSASVIKFIGDLAKDNDKKHRRNMSRRKSMRTGGSKPSAAFTDTQNSNRLLDDLIGGNFWATTETEAGARSLGDALEVDPDQAADSLPSNYDRNSGHLCMFLHPQVSLQSDVDEKSTIILTAFRAQLKVFSIVDINIADDPVNAQVLHQTFATLEGLQAFYPRKQARRATSPASCHSGAIFVPLEMLVDLRVEPWGFDRVVPRTSAALRYDKFNQLRMASKYGGDSEGGLGLPLPENHFQTGTDRIIVECDKFSVSANPDHFIAIYDVVTDLLLYRDPVQKSRNSKLEAVAFTGNFSNLKAVSDSVFELQQRIRALVTLQSLYQMHLDELDDEGRLELFAIRADATRLARELSVVVDGITRAQDFNGAREKNKSSNQAGVQLEARASELVWHMLDAIDVPFAKFSIKGAEFSWISKKDSSVSNRLVIKDLKALDSSPQHTFAEIIAKHEPTGDNPLCNADVFAAVLWNSLAPVGGIAIIEQFEMHLHPIRLQIEHQVGVRIEEYLFPQRHKRPKTIEDKATSRSPTTSNFSNRPPSVLIHSNRSAESLAVPRPQSEQFNRTMLQGDLLSSNRSSPRLASSAASISSVDHRLRRAASSEVLAPASQEEGLDADEMRLRASLYRTFVLVEISSTVLCLTYRSKKEEARFIPNVYDLICKTPSFQYRAKTWSFLDLLDQLKKDTTRSLFAQSGSLVGQLLSVAHRRLPLSDARSAAKKNIKSSIKGRFSSSKQVTSEPSSASRSPLARPTFESAITRDVPLVRMPSNDSTSSDESNSPAPFDPMATSPHILDRDFVAEPETLSIVSKEEETASSVESLPDTHPHVEPPPRHAKSAPPPSLRPEDNHVGYPHHHPLSRTLSAKSAETKARMLLGKSF